MIRRIRDLAKPIGWLIGITVFVVVMRSLAVDAGRVWASVTRVDRSLIAIAFGLLVAAHVLGAAEWWLLVRGLGARLSLVEAVVVHCTAALVKYLPGFGWHIVGKIELAGRRGVPRKLAAASLAFEFAAIIGGGALIALVTAPFGPRNDGSSLSFGLVAVVAIAGFGVAIVALRRTSLRAIVDLDGAFRPALVVGAALAMTATWTLVGSGTFALAGSVAPLGLEAWPVAMTATTVGFIGGLLALFAPTGIGVRESLIVFGLAPIINEEDAVVVAVLLRIVLMSAELLSYFLVQVIHRAIGDVTRVDQNSNVTAPKGR